MDRDAVLIAPQRAPDEVWLLAQLDMLLGQIGLCRQDSGGAHTIVQSEPCLASPHRLSAYAALSMLAAAHAAVALGRQRGGASQNLHVDLSYAVMGLNPEKLFAPTIDNRPYSTTGIADNPYLRAPYQTGDGQFMMLAGLYPAMAARFDAFFGCARTAQAVARAVGQWDGAALEAALSGQGLAATLCRTPKAWLAHPQGRALEQQPVLGYRHIGHAAPRRRLPAPRPLQGYRVLSLGRALAGPIVGRTLAEQGADVLGVCHPNYTEHEAVWCEANVGHRSCALDLRDKQARGQLEMLLDSADVVINNHQSARMREFGLDAESLHKRHPGLVHIGISAFGQSGPWASRSGFDMNASAATGIMMTEGAGGAPRLPSCHLLHDVAAGYLGAAAVTAALRTQALQGGSYDVHINLARCAMWCQSLGLIDESPPNFARPGLASRQQLRLVQQTALGRLERMLPCVRYSKTPSRWATPILVPQGSSVPRWQPRPGCDTELT
jgi:hypothetical protein